MIDANQACNGLGGPASWVVQSYQTPSPSMGSLAGPNAEQGINWTLRLTRIGLIEGIIYKLIINFRLFLK